MGSQMRSSHTQYPRSLLVAWTSYRAQLAFPHHACLHAAMSHHGGNGLTLAIWFLSKISATWRLRQRIAMKLDQLEVHGGF